jgi:hypothetical protein
MDKRPEPTIEDRFHACHVALGNMLEIFDSFVQWRILHAFPGDEECVKLARETFEKNTGAIASISIKIEPREVEFESCAHPTHTVAPLFRGGKVLEKHVCNHCGADKEDGKEWSAPVRKVKGTIPLVTALDPKQLADDLANALGAAGLLSGPSTAAARLIDRELRRKT